MTNHQIHKHGRKWKWFHKWIGIVLSVFVLVFCFSGIILNHRDAFKGVSVSRSIMPPAYRLHNYNNGIVRGTFMLSPDSLITFGNSGLYLTDNKFSKFSDFNDGLDIGTDNRTIRNVVRTRDGRLYCASQYALYLLEHNKWKKLELPGLTERLSDITLTPDSLQPVVLSRSGIYLSTDKGFEFNELKAPQGYEAKTTLFKTFWQLHSGALFGITGRIIVDIVALILIFLCITSIIVFITPYSMRKATSAKVRHRAAILKWNFRHHNSFGYYTIIFTVIIAFTGMCLRPPFMIPLVMVKTSPLPYTSMDSSNPWHDKLRGIRWDDTAGDWLISTSEGFISLPNSLNATPIQLDRANTPTVSPMGINVFEKNDKGEWLIGSFSGLFRWNRADSTVLDYFTGTPFRTISGRPLSNHAVSGFSASLKTGNGGSVETVFDYSQGAEGLPEMPHELKSQKMSLWNFALELHVGRCYTPFLGPISDLFVFISGLLLTLILISGLILNRRTARKKREHN